MASTETTGRKRTKVEPPLGLAAIGSSGPWEVEIDQSTTGAEKWFAQITGPQVSFCFEIESPRVVDCVLEMLQKSPRGNGRPAQSSLRDDVVVLSKARQLRIALRRDDEYADRFFLVVGPATRPLAQFTIAGTDRQKLEDALRQVRAELQE